MRSEQGLYELTTIRLVDGRDGAFKAIKMRTPVTNSFDPNSFRQVFTDSTYTFYLNEDLEVDEIQILAGPSIQ